MYINDLLPCDGVLRTHFIAHGPDILKSDGFLLEYNGLLLLIDGGHRDNRATLAYLLSMRARCLQEAGYADKMQDNNIKMRLTVAISHFHVDHATATTEHMIANPLFEIESIILPPRGNYSADLLQKTTPGDLKYRPGCMQALAEYQPDAKIIQCPFGAENRFSFPLCPGAENGPVVTVCPPVLDYGTAERIRYMADGYYAGDMEEKRLATCVDNANSVWIHVRMGAHSYLFTGDSMKREAAMTEEATDVMTAVYYPILGDVTVIKTVHHGFRREAAVDDMMTFSPEYLVSTCQKAGFEAAVRAVYPDCRVTFINSALKNVVFSDDGVKLLCE